MLTRTVKATCKKCGEVTVFQIGELSKEEVIEFLKKQNTFSCQGNHVELSSPMNYLEFDWSTLAESEEVTDEIFIEKLKETFELVYAHDELDKDFTVEGFQYGLCVAKRKDGEEHIIFDFKASPSGKRFYYAKQKKTIEDRK